MSLIWKFGFAVTEYFKSIYKIYIHNKKIYTICTQKVPFTGCIFFQMFHKMYECTRYYTMYRSTCSSIRHKRVGDEVQFKPYLSKSIINDISVLLWTWWNQQCNIPHNLPRTLDILMTLKVLLIMQYSI